MRCIFAEGGEAGCAGAAMRTTPMDESAQAGRPLQETCSTQSTVQAPGSAMVASHMPERPLALALMEGAIQTLPAATGPAAAAGRGGRKVGIGGCCAAELQGCLLPNTEPCIACAAVMA